MGPLTAGPSGEADLAEALSGPLVVPGVDLAGHEGLAEVEYPGLVLDRIVEVEPLASQAVGDGEDLLVLGVHLLGGEGGPGLLEFVA